MGLVLSPYLDSRVDEQRTILDLEEEPNESAFQKRNYKISSMLQRVNFFPQNLAL